MNIVDIPLAGFPPDNAVARILAPLGGDPPCGPPARFDPVFTDIRLLREEDDPSLPMGQWERPLKVADWALIETRCLEVLCTHSKHLQIAVWLAEAWMRQRGYAGLALGLAMLDALLRRYWQELHPLIDADGDCELRVAPLEWLSESLGLSVRLHALLLPLEEGKPPLLTLAEWEHRTAQDLAADAERSSAGDVAPATRADACALAAQYPAALGASGAALADCVGALQSIDDFLKQQLGVQAPNLTRLQATLAAAGRAVAQLAPAQQPVVPVLHESSGPPEPEIAAPPASAPAAVSEGRAPDGWHNRADAYATLSELADYLMKVEPHSPVPFLIRRALHWGSMPLPELIAEIIREEGDLNRLVSVLGLKMQ